MDESLLLTDEEINLVYEQWLHTTKEPKFINWTTFLILTQLAKCQDYYYERIAYLQNMVEQERQKTLREVGEWMSTCILPRRKIIEQLKSGKLKE